MNATPTIEVHKVSDLKPAPYNPRRIDHASMAALEKSLLKFGVVEPIVWNKRTGHVVGGHQRVKALNSAKVKETSVVVVDLSLEDEKALNVALNSPSLAGLFTEDLDSILDEIESDSADLFKDLRFDVLRDIAKVRSEEDAKQPPEEFKEYDEDIDTQHTCPKCGYKFSGNA